MSFGRLLAWTYSTWEVDAGLVQSGFLVRENSAWFSTEGDVYSYRDLNLLFKKISLAVVEGDCALSANNCQADAIPAAQSGVESGWGDWGAEEASAQKPAAKVWWGGLWSLWSVLGLFFSHFWKHTGCGVRSQKPAFKFWLSSSVRGCEADVRILFYVGDQLMLDCQALSLCQHWTLHVWGISPKSQTGTCYFVQRMMSVCVHPCIPFQCLAHE